MAEERSNLYLVDGSGYIFRAFFALPQLNNSRGMPTNAVFGFARMMLKLLKEARPEYIGVIFDSGKKSFRDDLFASYKANRVEMPSDLGVQIPYIFRVVDAFRLKRVVLDGYEADDVIGTLAARAARENFDVTIVTSDKDFMQIVNPRITLWDTMPRAGVPDKRTGVREVRTKFGVEPGAVVDIMALTGDPIDNVRGVPGVGEKTASALIQKFGSLDGLYANLDKIEESGVRGAKRVRDLLTQHRADAELARKLVTIDCNAPIPIEPSELKWTGGIDQAAAAALLRELEFHSMLEELTPTQGALPLSSAPETVVSKDDVPRVLNELGKAPTLGLHLDSSDGASQLKLSTGGEAATYVFGADLIDKAAPLLTSAKPPKTCHDLKEHLRMFAERGIELAGAGFDTMLAGFLINPGKPEPSLTDLYHEHLAPLGGSGSGGSEPVLVLALRDVLAAKMESNKLTPLFRDIEMPTAEALAAMETAGIAIDAAALRSISSEFGTHMAELESDCYKLAGRKFNLGSPIQLRDVLFTDLKLPTKGLKKTKSGYSTDVDTLTKLAADHALPRKILEYRAISKLKSTYSDALPALLDARTGRIHTRFHQALTATGRLSSTDPNLQNIPTRSEEGRRIRRAFVAPKGCVLLSADYSQIELRILAHLSGDQTLVGAFQQGEDIHVRTAMEVLSIKGAQVDAEARRLAKVINFGIIYGMGPQRLAGELGIALADASDYIKRYFERLPGVRAYIDETLRSAREQGYVTTMYGRRRYLPELNGPDGGARAQAERIAINTPLQGTAADLIKLAMVGLHRDPKPASLGARMLLQVHDELLFEVKDENLKETGNIVQHAMETVAELKVPLRVELKSGPNWAELTAQN